MASCPSGQYDENANKELNIGAITGASIVLIIVVTFIITYFVLKFRPELLSKSFGKSNKKAGLFGPGSSNVQPKTISGQFYNTLFGRFDGFFGGAIGQFSIGLLVAIMLSGLISAFNGMIIAPIIQVTIPDKKLFTTGIDLGRDVWFYPGQFFLSFLGFLFSIFFLFFLIDLLNQFCTKVPYGGQILKWFVVSIIIFIIVGLCCWNIYDVSKAAQPNCVDGTPQAAAAMKKEEEARGPLPPITPMNLFINPMGGVRFSI